MNFLPVLAAIAEYGYKISTGDVVGGAWALVLAWVALGAWQWSFVSK